ncbi:branched-chain amino acid ABC transporter permease [Auraticoccus monumenti]|uniref:Amino acid/amide ABC transporter membrane protein 2, HAAT family n=1 Tax=Auraticoccus monumenti TaxID=675864 RepID=A0A1G7DLL5_9ACTN|nr:branched-chain amino acid ABC transporter permease [Auraticoccus monumenti]SDE52016.1 amino acid/amide ABC transporter membrane protein 2, HAAT family [Auraticoccus monumenti]
MRIPTVFTPELQQRHGRTGWLVALVGAVLLVGSPYLPWAYGSDALDDMTYLGGPSPTQFLGLGLGALLLVCLLGVRFSGRLLTGRRSRWFAFAGGAKAAAVGAAVYVAVVLLAVTLELGGLINVEYGGWVALVGAVVALVGTRLLPPAPAPTVARVSSPAWLVIVTIAVVMLVLLLTVAYALDQDDPGIFVALLVFLVTVVVILLRVGLGPWFSAQTRRYRAVLVMAAFVAAFAFPFTQDGSEANMSIATQVLIFAATALGLNIVVGLAGLLDLGYIAFLGAGAFVAAILSGSAFSAVGWNPPFIVTVLISGLVASLLGLIIGSPTLRVSGDYLAIVTLAFGEIFRLVMINLDGSDGPDLTNGSNGIPGVPDLNFFGYDFGESHVILGIEIGRFANYYFLLLLVIALIMVVFNNLNRSRIGRGWVAIREDEKAAEAMGVNVFGLKLFAFAGGAFLAGVAGAVRAHHDISVTPDQYIFLESAFLLAAVVLGGMGTIVGVLLGAVLLRLMPEKLRFVDEYRLLIFGALLVLMMRFRPEGLVASRQRQLEFHEDDEELADKIDPTVPTTEGAR